MSETSPSSALEAPRLPRRLKAAEPGWTTRADVIVVGSGIAGLTTALRLRRKVPRVLLVTKTVLDAGSTNWAQGGIAAVMSPEDSPAEHVHDTLVAGVGLCDPDAVRTLVSEGTDAVWDLIALGADFDRGEAGELSLTREGGHHRDRILHAGGDATGQEIQRALIAQLERVKDDPGIEVIEHALVVDLLTEDDGRVTGVTLHVIGEGQMGGVGAAYGRAVVMATGGLGQIYASTTNPPVATGDGMAAALRAGAELADLEFVQFHPTVLYLGEGSTGQQPLISEAVRGEGAFLVDVHGTRFMQGVHAMADLAPRDVVSRAIIAQMRATGTDHVLLDARHLGGQFLERRFPGIVARCRELGFDPATQLLPVAPAQHYASGGIRVDLYGRSSLEGLYACGETSCTGVHGANRLASNSLLEGLVFARRIADDLTTRLSAGELPAVTDGAGSGLGDGSAAGFGDGGSGDGGGGGGAEPERGELVDASRRLEVQRALTTGSGSVRSAQSTARAARVLAEIRGQGQDQDDAAMVGPASWETTNIVHLGAALTWAASMREETRGGHVREDFPERDDASFLHHYVLARGGDGVLTVRVESVPRSNLEGLDLDGSVAAQQDSPREAAAKEQTGE